jgi:hypothetical protein
MVGALPREDVRTMADKGNGLMVWIPDWLT